MAAAVHPLKAYRAREKLTQLAAATKVGVTRESWARWETRTRKVDRDLLPIVATETGIPARELRPDLVEDAEKLLSEAAE